MTRDELIFALETLAERHNSTMSMQSWIEVCEHMSEYFSEAEDAAHEDLANNPP